MGFLINKNNDKDLKDVKITIESLQKDVNELKDSIANIIPTFNRNIEIIDKQHKEVYAFFKEQNDWIKENKEGVSRIKATISELKNFSVEGKKLLMRRDMLTKNIGLLEQSFEKRRKQIESFSFDNFIKAKEKSWDEQYVLQMKNYLDKGFLFICDEVNKKKKEISETYNKELDKMIVELQLEKEQTFEWASAEMQKPEVFISVLIRNIKIADVKKDQIILEKYKRHLKNIVPRNLFTDELKKAIIEYDKFTDSSNDKKGNSKDNLFTMLRNLQRKIEEYNLSQQERDKIKEKAQAEREAKMAKQAAIRKVAQKEYKTLNDDDSDSEDEKPTSKKPAKSKSEDSEDEDVDEEESEDTEKVIKEAEEDSDEDESEDEDTEEDVEDESSEDNNLPKTLPF
jgi:hypothetical protein